MVCVKSILKIIAFNKKLSPFGNKLNHNAVPENISNGGKFIGLGIPHRYLY